MTAKARSALNHSLAPRDEDDWIHVEEQPVLHHPHDSPEAMSKLGRVRVKWGQAPGWSYQYARGPEGMGEVQVDRLLRIQHRAEQRLLRLELDPANGHRADTDRSLGSFGVF